MAKAQSRPTGGGALRPATSSKAWATRSSSASANGRPTSCSPIGMPLGIEPHGQAERGQAQIVDRPDQRAQAVGDRHEAGVAAGVGVGDPRASRPGTSAAPGRRHRRRPRRRSARSMGAARGQRPQIVDAGEREARLHPGDGLRVVVAVARPRPARDAAPRTSASITARRRRVERAEAAAASERVTLMPASARCAMPRSTAAATSASTSASRPSRATASRKPAHAAPQRWPHSPGPVARLVVGSSGSAPAIACRTRATSSARAGQRADMVEREGKRHAAGAADPAIGRLQPDQPAAGGRDRGSSRRCRSPGSPGSRPCRHRGGPAAGRAAGDPARVPGVARVAGVRVVAGDAERELDHVEPADIDRHPPRRGGRGPWR